MRRFYLERGVNGDGLRSVSIDEADAMIPLSDRGDYGDPLAKTYVASKKRWRETFEETLKPLIPKELADLWQTVHRSR